MARSVFVSSTSQDLQSYRQAVHDAILRVKMHPINMDNFGSDGGGAVGVSVRKVREAEYFVGIIAHRYGYVPEGSDKSVTEQEYDEAVRKRLPRLMYVVQPDSPTFQWQPELVEQDATAQQRLNAFKTRIDQNEVRSYFTTPENLALQIAADLAKQDVKTTRRRRLQTLGLGTLTLAAGLLLTILLAYLTAPDSLRRTLIQVGLARPDPMPSSGFNVLIAGIGLQRADGSIVRDADADAVAEVLYASLDELSTVDNLRGARDLGVDHILDATEAARRKHAAELAETHAADVVIFGVVHEQPNEFELEFEPQLYIANDLIRLQPEIAGVETFGSPISLLRDWVNNTPTGGLSTRVSTLRLFLDGLALFIHESYPESQRVFEEAIALNPGAGMEVLYIMAGSAAARDFDFLTALDLYTQTLDEARPHYGRGLLGRGIALLSIAAQIDREHNPPYDPDRHLPAGTVCAEPVDNPLEMPIELLIELAEICDREAIASNDQTPDADIDIKAAGELGRLYFWRSYSGFGDHYDDAIVSLERAIALYDAAPADSQLRTRNHAAIAHGFLGRILLRTDCDTPETWDVALQHYRDAIALLIGDSTAQVGQADYYQSLLNRGETERSCPYDDSASA